MENNLPATKKERVIAGKIIIPGVGLPCFGMRGYHKSVQGGTMIRYIHTIAIKASNCLKRSSANDIFCSISIDKDLDLEQIMTSLQASLITR